MEHNVYVCGWSESDDGFELWVSTHPRVRGYGRTCAEAEQSLLDAILDGGGAIQAVLEFQPPLPQSEFERKYSVPKLYTVCGDERFETDEPKRIPFETDDERLIRESWYDEFFTSPCCRECRVPQGPRNDRQLNLTYIRSNYDGGFVTFSGTSMYIFSEQFLKLLSKDEKQRMEFRPVGRTTKARRQYFELVGPSGPRMVAVAGLKMSGWVCDACGFQRFGYRAEGVGIHAFIAESDLPTPVTEVFTVGTEPNVSLCVTAERWATMVGSAGTRGFTSQLLGVVSNREVRRDPELETLQKQRRR
jgi:hypothetical protein